MKYKSQIVLSLILVGVILIAGWVGQKQIIPPLTQTPVPLPQTFRFEATPIQGAPPLQVSFGAFSSDPLPLLPFDRFTIDYGYGFKDSLQQECLEPPDPVCQIRAEHKYTASGTFSATLYGIKKGSSQVLGTLTIAVGNPLMVTKTVGEHKTVVLGVGGKIVGGEEGFVFPIQTITPYSIENIEKYDPYHSHISHYYVGYKISTSGGDTYVLTNINYSTQKVTFTKGEIEDGFFIQKINPDSVEGFIYFSYPIASPRGTARTLHIGDDIGESCNGESEKLTSIDFSGQRLTFTLSWEKPPYGGCPICLADNTFIDTPNGSFNIKEMRSGMLVWTSDSLGHKQPAIILKSGKTQVLSTHKMIHLVLEDGRELFASQGHPTTDGRIFGDIKPGDSIDTAHVKSVEIVPYDKKYTYDILPSGDTGFYWANGILVGSTLK